MDSKEYFIKKVKESCNINDSSRILDLGSGRSENFESLINNNPSIRYVGIEPIKRDANTAKKLFSKFSNVKIYNQWSARGIDGFGDFELCLSLSVLEHVKRLEEFLIESIDAVKDGGYIVHRYDLGHALSPSSLKEKFQVFLGNNFPNLLPERKFVRYLDPEIVIKIMEGNGTKVEKITYHQMPNHKKFLRHFLSNDKKGLGIAEKIIDWEFEISPFLGEMDKSIRENLFPTIAIWAKKNS